MNTRSTTISRSLVAALVGFTLAVAFAAGPGHADPEVPPAAGHLDAGGTFGPTVPLSVDRQSAETLTAIIDGGAAPGGSANMRFISVDEGVGVDVIASDGGTATVRLSDGKDEGRVGYVPAAWVTTG